MQSSHHSREKQLEINNYETQQEGKQKRNCVPSFRYCYRSVQLHLKFLQLDWHAFFSGLNTHILHDCIYEICHPAGVFLCWVYMLQMLWVLSGHPASSHSPKICMWVYFSSSTSSLSLTPASYWTWISKQLTLWGLSRHQPKPWL